MKFWQTVSIISQVLSLTLGLYSTINIWIDKHKTPSIKIKWLYPIANQLNLCIVVSNMSSSPVALTKFCLANNKNFIDSTLYPVLFTSSSVAGDRHCLAAFSDSVPINVSPKTSKEFILAFTNDQISDNFFTNLINKGQKLSFIYKLNEKIFHLEISQSDLKNMLLKKQEFTNAVLSRQNRDMIL
ncbi:hypothetical protein NX781_09590 [Lactobacillus kullabergensis]|uniref:hypothetical protein n=1 Tax=Lactobacillus kullabergensis TaxID=1218493 RepID=UPI00224861F2|nr:hypothetical protein [Lactobacillus kullabergensis]MCX0292048.1 hypothetical protein [Lactobacillus kullabergensis]